MVRKQTGRLTGLSASDKVHSYITDFEMLPAGCDPFKKQNGRRRGDLFPRPREEVLRFGTFLWNGGTAAGTDIPDPKPRDDVPLSRESPPFSSKDPISEWP
jgi:hypothetical protein